MQPYFEAFLVALVVATLLTPAVRAVVLRTGPAPAAGGRNVHVTPVPRFGGIAILVGFMLALAVACVRYPPALALLRGEGLRTIGIVAGCVGMALIGVADDRWGIRALHKLLLQIAVAIGAFACGLRIDAVTIPGLGDISMGIAALPVTVAWMVGITNAVNLIDGLDGLAGGIVIFASITNLVVALLSHNPFVAITMAALSGAVLGFLFFNFNPARIFMGDSGSYFLGYALASTVLVGSASQKTSTAVGLLVPCLALGVPIFDTLFSVVRRFLERRPLFAPDRGHVHHRLLDLGLTHRRAVLVIYALSLVFCVAAIAVKAGREWHVGIAIAVLCVVVVLFLRFAGYVEYIRLRVMRRGRVRPPVIEALRRALPGASARFATGETEDAIFEELRTLVAPLDLDVLELAFTDGRALAIFVRNASRNVQLDDERTTVQFGDDASGQVTFVWPRSKGECTPDVEILFQVLVDMLQPHLARVGSPWARSVPSARAPASKPIEGAALHASHPNELS